MNIVNIPPPNFPKLLNLPNYPLYPECACVRLYPALPRNPIAPPGVTSLLISHYSFPSPPCSQFHHSSIKNGHSSLFILCVECCDNIFYTFVYVIVCIYART